jgi:hypothetical protein
LTRKLIEKAKNEQEKHVNKCRKELEAQKQKEIDELQSGLTLDMYEGQSAA